jgi:hypothetical protein
VLGRRMPAVPAQTPTIDGVATPLTRTNLTEYRYQVVAQSPDGLGRSTIRNVTETEAGHSGR